MSELIEKQVVIDWLKYKWNRNADSLFYGIQGLPSAQPVGYVHINDVYRLISGHSNYHGDNILSALTCLAEGKDVPNPIITLAGMGGEVIK